MLQFTEDIQVKHDIDCLDNDNFIVCMGGGRGRGDLQELNELWTSVSNRIPQLPSMRQLIVIYLGDQPLKM